MIEYCEHGNDINNDCPACGRYEPHPAPTWELLRLRLDNIERLEAKLAGGAEVGTGTGGSGAGEVSWR